MAFDASPSWSGFHYQGKVALYYALNLINAGPVGTDFSLYSLMLEDTEDFEIIYDGNSVSIHQVKAYNSSAYSKYSDALMGIILELYKQPETNGRIHTWKRIDPKINFQNLEASIKDDLKEILDQYRETIPKTGSTLLEKASSQCQNKQKKAAILHAAFPGHTETQLYDILNSIYTYQNNAISRLESYMYDDGNRFCELEAINEKIKNEISSALIERGIPSTQEQLEKKFHNFLGVIDKYIIKRHKEKQNEEKIPIEFSKIVQSLETDHEDIGIEYLAFKFKEKFARLTDEYIGDPEDYEEPEDEQHCNLKEARKILLSLSPQELWEHYRSFSPHICLDHDNNTDNAFNIDTSGIRYVLLKSLHKINIARVSHNASKYKYTYRTNTLPYRNYLPTTITDTAKVTQIEKSITSNPCISEILYEVEYLIYSGSKSHAFSPASMIHTEAPRAEDEDPRSKREEVLKQITLVPILEAKERLA